MALNKQERKKQDFQIISTRKNRTIAFSKKKMGLCSKLYKFASTFGCECAGVFRTENMKWHAYSYPPSEVDLKRMLQYFLKNRHRSKCTTAADMKGVRFISYVLFNLFTKMSEPAMSPSIHTHT